MVYCFGKLGKQMSKITVKEVEALAKLARVGLTEDEKISISGQMTEILEYAKQLNEVDTSSVEPTSQVTGLTNIYRKDIITVSAVGRDDLLSNAPEAEDGFIRVRSVLK
jgi:aspartyl-tRNA(Asn)/glutamyl-tRNA(Gln) amidotransferase subunit C